MAQGVKVLGLAGSLRAGSYNKKLVQIALGGAKAAGAEVTFVELRDLALPIYDEDLEKSGGLPAGALRLKELMTAHHGLLVASPEYNSSVSAALKNAIDWASRPAPNETSLQCFKGRVAGLVAASPGALGGLRGLVHLRAILGNLGVIVLPEQLAIAKAHEAIGVDGRMVDPKQQQAVEAIGAAVAKTAAKLNA
ncbi:MAG: NADPH-dependent FMN reductase [Phycisphaerae bacterium]